MEEKNTEKAKLPLPIWCFVVLAIATLLTIPAFILDQDLGGIFFIAIWASYLLWIIISKRLTKPEKIQWFVMVLAINIIGMLIFYIFMIRSYLGQGKKASEKYGKHLDKFLAKYNVKRTDLTNSQIEVLAKYCGFYRYSPVITISSLIISALVFYFAFFSFPEKMRTIIRSSIPTECIIINETTGTKKIIKPDQDDVDMSINIWLYFGYMGGIAYTMGLFILFQGLALKHNWQRIIFIDFIKGINEPSDIEETSKSLTE